jgi:hypothetical protein
MMRRPEPAPSVFKYFVFTLLSNAPPTVSPTGELSELGRIIALLSTMGTFITGATGSEPTDGRVMRLFVRLGCEHRAMQRAKTLV